MLRIVTWSRCVTATMPGWIVLRPRRTYASLLQTTTRQQGTVPNASTTSSGDQGVVLEWGLEIRNKAFSLKNHLSIKRRFVRQLPPKPPGTAAEAGSDCFSPLQPTTNCPSRQIVRREG